MKSRIIALILGLGLVSPTCPLELLELSVAQSRDPEAQRNAIVLAKEIVQKLEAGRQATQDDLDLLEKVSSRLDQAGNDQADEPGKAETGINVAAAKEIIHKLKTGKQATQDDLDLLEKVLSRLDQAGNHQAGEPGKTAIGVNVAAAKEIIHKLKTGKQATQDDLDLLERVLLRTEKAANLQAGELGKVASGLSRYRTKDGVIYIYVVDLDQSDLRPFWLDRKRRPYESITRLDEEQSAQGYRLKFAINGGIYDQRFRPKGLYIEQGRLLAELDTAKTGPNRGNFYLEPNGVFVIDTKGNARILTTQRFREQFPSRARKGIQLAVQSGPALLVDGAINPQFAKESINKKRRSGVGVINERWVVFGISSRPTSFYQFATLFERLGCRDALYLDGGEVGALYSREDNLLIHADAPLVTILAVIEKVRTR